MPEVTVLLCVHNGGDHLDEAIASILAQSFTDFELLIIDDGSTDQTPDIICAVRDPRIRSIRHDSNRGLISVLNEGLELSLGRYIARMDADDVCHKERLQIQYRFLENHPEVGVLGTGVRIINGKGYGRVVYEFPEQHEVITWALSFVCPLVHPTIMMRRDLIRSAGGYSAQALHAEDYDLWERLLTKTRFANLCQPLLCLRKHGSSVTVRNATIHGDMARSISTRAISTRLGRPIDESIVACVRGDRDSNERNTSSAAGVIMELYRSVSPKSMSTCALIRQETAMRLAMLVARPQNLSLRIELLRKAFETDSWVIGRLCRRFLGRLTGWGVQRLVGCLACCVTIFIFRLSA